MKIFKNFNCVITYMYVYVHIVGGRDNLIFSKMITKYYHNMVVTDKSFKRT